MRPLSAVYFLRYLFKDGFEILIKRDIEALRQRRICLEQPASLEDAVMLKGIEHGHEQGTDYRAQRHHEQRGEHAVDKPQNGHLRHGFLNQFQKQTDDRHGDTKPHAENESARNLAENGRDRLGQPLQNQSFEVARKLADEREPFLFHCKFRERKPERDPDRGDIPHRQKHGTEPAENARFVTAVPHGRDDADHDEIQRICMDIFPGFGDGGAVKYVFQRARLKRRHLEDHQQNTGGRGDRQSRVEDTDDPA